MKSFPAGFEMEVSFLPEKLAFEAFIRYDDSGNGNFTSVPHRTYEVLKL
jgi:hypothetical protein